MSRFTHNRSHGKPQCSALTRSQTVTRSQFFSFLCMTSDTTIISSADCFCGAFTAFLCFSTGTVHKSGYLQEEAMSASVCSLSSEPSFGLSSRNALRRTRSRQCTNLPTFLLGNPNFIFKRSTLIQIQPFVLILNIIPVIRHWFFPWNHLTDSSAKPCQRAT